MKNESIISIYGSHNGGVSVYHNGEIHVIESERFYGIKNCGLCQYKTPTQYKIDFSFQEILRFLNRHYNIPLKFDKCLHQSTDYVIGEERFELTEGIDCEERTHCLHHESHANGSFYQSDFLKALVLSYDGGGNDGTFNIYLADRKKGIKLIKNYFMVNLGFPYMIFGHYFSDIAQEMLSQGNLVYSGKIMGLEAYGKVVEKWLPFFEDFYDCPMHADFQKVEEDYFYVNKLNKLSEHTGITFDEVARLEGEEEYNTAATSQKAFENVFIKYARPFIEEHPKLPIILTGGCALNISLNSRIKEEFNRPMFIAPNSNDSGLSLGMLLGHLKPQQAPEVTYCGLPLLDRESLLSDLGERLLGNYAEEDINDVCLESLAGMLKAGKIIGVARGNSEHGPRALGNRSILCNPSIEGMKDTLNEKVKHREWFRPFAPVVRLEDVNKYFLFNGESRHMTYSCKVKKAWRKKLKAVTHIDNTARIQTVKRTENPWLYDLLTYFDSVNDHGVLLNTSLNVNGKPILSTIKDAVQIFDEGLDALVIDDLIISKNDK
jgi:carbamoyltransferase